MFLSFVGKCLKKYITMLNTSTLTCTALTKMIKWLWWLNLTHMVQCSNKTVPGSFHFSVLPVTFTKAIPRFNKLGIHFDSLWESNLCHGVIMWQHIKSFTSQKETSGSFLTRGCKKKAVFWPFGKTTIMDKSSWNTPKNNTFFVERVRFPISNFDRPLRPFDVVITWRCPLSVFQHWKEGGGGVWLSTKKTFFNNGWMLIKSVYFAQMCQHFCPWL